MCIVSEGHTKIRSTAKCVCLQLRVICSIQCTVYLLISFHCCTKKHTHGSVYTFFSNWCEVSYLCIRCTSYLCYQGAQPQSSVLLQLRCHQDLTCSCTFPLTIAAEFLKTRIAKWHCWVYVLLGVCFKRWLSKLFLFLSLLPGSWRTQAKMGTHHNARFQPQRVCTIHWSQNHRNHAFKIEAGVGLWQPWYQSSAACAVWFSRCCKLSFLLRNLCT